MSKFLFIIQGEGRGHLTQALSLAQILEGNGHTVVAALVGIGKGRQLPTFFTEEFYPTIHTFDSPHLVFSSKGISFSKTIFYHVFRLKRYILSLSKIRGIIQKHEPDVIVNFYDVLGGVYAFLYRPQIPIVCVGHHYLFLHPNFLFPQKYSLDRWLLKVNTKVTAARAEKLLSLSFHTLSNLPLKRIFVTPPLLRLSAKEHSVTYQDYFLVYITYASMSASIIQWHKENPTILLHCFWDNHNYPEEYIFDDTLTFHRVNGQKFLQMMADCRALVTTAGFESVCEAMYMGKPAMMVPAHYEQACNALDAQKAGAGVAADTFDLSILLKYLPQHQPIQAEFQNWCDQTSAIFLQHVEEVVRDRPILVGFS